MNPSSGRIFVLLAPVLALGALAALLAYLAGLSGWNPHVMMPLSGGMGIAATLLALGLAYRLRTQGRASDRALHDVEARVGGILDSAMDGIVTVDEQQRVVQYNGAAEKMFRWPRAAVIGQPLDMLLPERFRPGHRKDIEQFGRTGVTSRRMGLQTVVTGLRANSEEFPIEASISQVTAEDGAKFYTVILRDVTERVRAEQALERSKEELRELAALSQSLREREKSQVARELHDELAQALTALKMDVSWIAERLPEGDKPISTKVSAVLAMLDATVAATRRIAADLRPLMLDDLGLVPAVEWLVQNFIERTGVACELAIDSENFDLDEPYASAVFRIVQESLTNIARHARATQVEVAFERAGRRIGIRVRDNGRGFLAGDRRKPKTFGLMGLRERASLLGGEARIESEPGRGTAVEVTIPLDDRVPQT
jgi:PAS domain S-box-containing protein